MKKSYKKCTVIQFDNQTLTAVNDVFRQILKFSLIVHFLVAPEGFLRCFVCEGSVRETLMTFLPKLE